MDEWQITLSVESERFIRKNNISELEIINSIEKAGYKILGQDINIEIKKLKGKLKDLYRIKSGKLRILLKINFNFRVIFIEDIKWRSEAYKKQK